MKIPSTLSILLPLALICAVATTDVRAQRAAVIAYGSGCSQGGMAAPVIGHRGLPQLGARFDITYSGPNFAGNSAQQRAQPYLMVGFQQAAVAIGRVLPAQAPGCTLWLTPRVVLPMPTDPLVRPRYVAHYTWDVPSDPVLLGSVFFQQWMVLFSQCGIAGCDPQWAATSGAALVLIGT